MSVAVCPVCKGRGQVPKEFYENHRHCITTVVDDSTTCCLSCDGRGYVFTYILSMNRGAVGCDCQFLQILEDIINRPKEEI